MDDSCENETDHIINFVTLLDKGKAFSQNYELSFNDMISSIDDRDVLTIIYTSGTGGSPKGVMLSHGAMLTNCTGAKELLKNLVSDLKEIRFLSWLPLSHSYEHTLQFYEMGIDFYDCSKDLANQIKNDYSTIRIIGDGHPNEIGAKLIAETNWLKIQDYLKNLTP